MATIGTTPATFTVVPPLVHHRFTVGDYHRMGEAGILTERDRVELIRGEIVMMSPIGSKHAGCVNALMEMLVVRLVGAASVQVQNPIGLDKFSEPQPDLSVLKYRPDSYRSASPVTADVLLVIEVADSTLESDRGVKLPLYAEAGIPEYWLVDLQNERVEVYRTPAGGSYAEKQVLARGERIVCGTFPQLALDVAAILG
ncbi:MAG: Uma2 family endonuclease [Pirellula sp.]|nr:Uma2 family endonuclease [Pirellula sp.]